MDVKKLGVVVEQKGIAPTAKNLESLAKASDTAAPAVERLSSSLKGFKNVNLDSFASKLQDTATAIKEVKASTSGMADMAKNIGGLSINLTNIANATDRISGKTKELDSFTASIRQLREELTQMKGVSSALSNIKIGATSGGSGGRSGASAVDAEIKAQQRLLTQIERTSMMVGRTKAEYLELRAAQAGISSAAAPYIAKLKEADVVTGKLGMTTKGYNAALRMIPAQYTDIAVQLAGGQNPMLVLLQQGGQLKDMFGGVGNAAKAVASSIFSLTGVATMAAGAIGGVTYAAYLGSQELTEYKNNVILTNNAMALSVGTLADMSNAIVASTGATRGSVTELLASMTSNGKVASDMFNTITDAAIRLERSGGQAASKTVEEFESLGTKPVEAVVKLDQKYNFLTASVYKQIQALQAQGNEIEAARVAQQAFADALDKRIPLMEQNLGTLQKMWRAIKDEVMGAVDALKGFGREKSIKELQDTIAQIESEPATARSGRQARLDGLKQQLAILQQQQAIEDRVRLNAADADIQRKDALKRETSAQELRKKYMLDEKTLQEKIKEINDSNLSTAEKTLAVRKVTEQMTKPVAGTKNDVAQQYAAELSAEKNFAETQIKLVKDRLAQQVISEEKSAAEIYEIQKTSFTNQTNLLKEQLAKTKDVGNKAKIGEQLKDIQNQSVIAQSAYTTALSKMAKKNEEYQAGVIAATEKFIKKQEEENEALGLQIDNLGQSAEMQGRNEQEKLRSAAASEYLAAATLRERAMQMLANEENKDAAQFYLELAAAREKAGKAIDEQASLRLEKGMKEQRIEQEKEWKKTSEKISDSITDSLMRGFEKGKSFAENLRDTIENMFNTLVLRPIVEVTVTGGLSMLGLGGSSSASASTLGSIGNLASTGSSLWSAYSGGVSSLYGSFATSGVGSALGLSTAQAAGYMAPVYGAGGSLLSAGSGTAAGGLTGLGSTIGAALPAIGVSLAAVTAITSLMKKGGGAKTEGDVYATLSKTGESSFSATDRLGENWITGTNSNTVVENLVTPVGKAVASLITSLGGNAAGIGLNLGFSTDPKGTAADNIQSGVTNAAGEYVYRNGRNAERGTYATELELETQRMLVAAVKAADVAQVYKDVANSVDLYSASAEELQSVLSNLTAIATLRTAFDNIGFGAENLSTALIAAAGGAATLTANLDSYYQNFYTEGERQAKTLEQVKKSMEGLGLTLPTTREGFRALVEAQDLTTDAGQKTFAALIGLSSSFASATDSATGAVNNLSDAMKNLQAQTVDLEIELLAAQGKTSESLEKQRLKSIKGMTAAEVALYDYNAAIQKQIDTINSAFDSLSSIGSARTSIFDSIFNAQLSGATTSEQVAILKKKEDSLWESLLSGNVSAASDLASVIEKRLQTEASIKEEATSQQLKSAQELLDTMKSVSAFASSMHNEALSLAASDLSALSYKEQLNSAEQLWRETLSKAMAGDTTAQSSLSGVGKSYLEEARSYYGANTEYASVFSSVMSAFDSFSSTSSSQAKIDAQQQLVDSLTKTSSQAVSYSKEQVEALKVIDAALEKQQENTEAQLKQNGVAYSAILAALTKIDSRLVAVESTNRQALLA